MKATEAYLQDFTVREDKLLKIVKEQNLMLPHRLMHWRIWIGDSQIYLNELKNFVDLNTDG